MKKFTLLSVVAAVALSTSAYAVDVKVFGEAKVKGAFERTPGKAEGKKYFNLDAKLGFEVKNEDGVSLKTNFVIYDAPFGAASENKGTGTNSIAPQLDYAYVTVPSLFGVSGLKLRSGYIESGEFGSSLTANGESIFQPIDLSLKVSDALILGCQQEVEKEANTNQKGGILPLKAARGDTSIYKAYAKGMVDGIGYGVKANLKVENKKDAAGNGKEETMTHVQAYVSADMDGFDAIAHLSSKNFSEDRGQNMKKSQLGLYGAANAKVDNFKAGLGLVMLKDGYTAGKNFGPTYLLDDDVLFGNNVTSLKKKDTTLFVIPVSVDLDPITIEAQGTFGKVLDESFREFDVGATYALGKMTDLSLKYAFATGDAINANKENKNATLVKWTLETKF